MSDSNFSSIVHRRRCLNDIVDSHWEADSLPNDDIVLPPELSLNSDSLEEKGPLLENEEEDTWQDLALHQFS